MEVYGSHSYGQAGDYTITTTITSDGNALDPVTNNVTVADWDTSEADNFVSFQNPPQTIFDPPQTPTPPPYSQTLQNLGPNLNWMQATVGVTPPNGACKGRL